MNGLHLLPAIPPELLVGAAVIAVMLVLALVTVLLALGERS